MNMKAAEFKDTTKEAMFNQQGFLLLKGFLKPSEIKILHDLYLQFDTDHEPMIMWNSLYHTSRQNSRFISEEILKIFRPKIKETFNEAKSILGTVMSKRPNQPTAFDTPHRDYSVLDEDQFQYRQLWVPLVDIAKENGAMYVIPGSHKLNHNILPVVNKCPYREHMDFIIKHAQPVFMEAGDLLVYADKTLHGGFVNESGKERPVVHFAIFPPEAKLKYYRKPSDTDVIEEYDVPDDFYMDTVIEIKDLNNLPTVNYKMGRQIKLMPFDIDYKKIAQFSNICSL